MIMKPYKDISLSRLGMGNMRLPLRTDLEGNPIDREKGQEIIDYAMKSGVNYYDTAYVYNNGDSEKFLGEAMAKYDRKSYYLATKFLISANPDYKAVFQEQLKRLNTDYIDFYLVHSVTERSYKAYEESGCIDYFRELKKQGKIRYLGFSNHSSPEILKHFRDLNDWDFIQLQLNYYDWNYGSTKAEYELCAEKNIPVMVMEPVRGGKLANLTPEANVILKEAHPDWSIASWAFRWVRSLPQVQVILSGMSDMEQIKDNVKTFGDDTAFTEEDGKLLMEACKMFKSQIQVPCTACRYCCDGCPSGIDIPKIMEMYNNYKLTGPWALDDIRRYDKAGSKDCIECGNCTSHCPQSIDVPKIMKELTEALQ